MIKAAIHQPQYIPWIPYFDKILQSDIFILLDNVQFQKNGLQNRNRLKGAMGVHWLTLPVRHKLGQLICETKIADVKILKKHLKTFETNYKKAAYFSEIMELLKENYEYQSENLSVFCCDIIENILKYLNYQGKIYKNSKILVNGKESELILNICKTIKADIYLSGQGAKSYLDINSFVAAGIKVEFQKYNNPSYTQCFAKTDFDPDLSILDLLFNVGNESLTVIESGRVPSYVINEQVTEKLGI